MLQKGPLLLQLALEPVLPGQLPTGWPCPRSTRCLERCPQVVTVMHCAQEPALHKDEAAGVGAVYQAVLPK